MVCHPDCRARCRHRVYLQVLPPSRVFCRPLFKGSTASVLQAPWPGCRASLSRLFFLRGRVLGRPRGGRWGGGPCGAWPFRAQALRRSPACPRPPCLCVRSSGRLQIPLTCHPSRFSRLSSPCKPLQTHAGRMRGPPARCSGQLLTVSGEKASRLGRGPWGQGLGCFLSLFPAPGVALGTPHCTKELGRRAVIRAE